MPIEDQSRYYRDYNENLKNDIHCLLTISDKARDTGKQINRTFSFVLPMSLTLYHNFFSVFFCSSLNKKRKKHFCYFRCLGSTWTQLLCRYFRTGRWSMVNLCPPSSHYHCFKHFLRATDSLLIRLAHYLYLTGITGAPLGNFREGGGSFGHI